MKMAGQIQKMDRRHQIKHAHGCNMEYQEGTHLSRRRDIRSLSLVLSLLILSFSLTILTPASSFGHTLGTVPYWDGGAGADFAPVLWPSDNDWMAYTWGRQTINDPRVNDPSNGGTTPQNYVNVSSGCPDETKPSMYIHYANDTLYFRWRVEQIPNTYATGPAPGVFSDVSPWKSAQWTVMMDTDGDGFREFATQLDGSTGMPAYPVDILRTVYSNTLSQNMDPHDRDIIELWHNPTGFVDRSTGIMLNFQGTNTSTTSWPNGPAETVWDYGTTRAIDISSSDTSPCSATNENEYYVDYQIPLDMLGNGTYDFDCTKPAGLFFSTANSLTNPFQKDVVAGSTAFVATPEACVPFGDPVILCGPDGPVIVPQPVVDWITSDTTTCNVGLTAMVRGAIVPNSCTPNIASVNFYYYLDTNANGIPDDGSSWVLIGAGTMSATDPTLWTIDWNTIGSGLQRGQYLIGVEAVNSRDEHTWSYLTPAEVLVQKGAQPTHNANPYLPEPGSTVLVGKALLGGTCGETVVVDKTVNDSSVATGDNVQFTITLHNNTANTLTVNSVTDYLPQGAGGTTFTYVSTDGGTLTPDIITIADATVTWTFSPAKTIAAGGTGTIIFTATVPNVEGTYQNTCGSNVTVTSWGGLTKNISCNYVEIAVGAPRLTIAKTADQITRAVGEQINYTITYSNDSPANVTGAYITDVLPAGLTFVSAADGGTYTEATRTIRWDIGSVQAGTGPFTVSFAASVTSPYPPTEPVKLKNTATIYSNETTPKQADVTVIVTGLSRPLLTIQKMGDKMFVDPTAATPADRVTYTIAYSNVGNATATVATITDEIPTGWIYVSSLAGTNCPAGITTGNPVTSVTWNLGDIAVNSTGTCNLILRASDTAPSPYVGDNPSTNTASIQATNFPSVTSSFTVGLTGANMTCPGETFFFHNEFTNVGFDGTKEIASTDAPSTGPSALKEVTWMSKGCTANDYTPIADFYMDPPLVNNGTISTITSQWYITKRNGNPSNVRVSVYDYNPADGVKIPLAQVIHSIKGADPTPNLDSDSFLLNSEPSAGHRLYWLYEGCTSANNQMLDVVYYYDGIYTKSNGQQIPTPSRFCYQGLSVVMNKTVDKMTALPDDTLTYSITFGNNGGSNLTGAQIVDTLPPGTTFVSATLNGTAMSASLNCPTPGALEYCASGQIITFNVRSSDTANAGQITTGMQGALVITVTVDNPFPAGQYELINNATLDTLETEPITSSARTVVTTDISVSKSVDKTLLYPGDTATFTLKVINSSGAAISVNISDVLPTDTYFTYVDGSASYGGVYTSGDHTLNWTGLSIPANGSLSVTFQMTVALTGVPLGITYKDNTGIVTYGSQQYSNTVTVVILNNPNINITKSVSPAGPVAAGDTITWTMSVTNNGPQSALGVIVADPIIAYTVYKAGSLVYESAAQTDPNDPPTDTSYFDAVNNRTVFEVGTLPGGETRTMSFSAVVDRPMPNGTTTLTNTATVSSSNTITKQASASIDVTDAPSFVLNKYAASLHSYFDAVNNLTVVPSGENVTFTIYYKNTGGATATSVVVTDTLATNLTFVSADNGGTYDSGSRVVTWDLGSLLPDSEGVLHLTVTTAVCDTYANTATIDSSETSPLDSNTTSTVYCGLEPDKSTTTPEVTNTSTGTQATYILTVSNPTSTTATDVRITDNFSSGFTYDSSVTPVFGGTGSTRTAVVNPDNGANHATWGTWDVAAGGSVTIQFAAKVDSSVPEGTYDNNVVATSANKSVLLFDELATTADDVKVLVPVDLSVTKTVNDLAYVEIGPEGPDGEFIYTITLTNVGVNHSFKVILEDLLPSDVTYVSNTTTQGSYDNATGIWDVGRVDRNAGATLTINAYPNAGTAGMEIQNCASLTSSVPPEPSYADPDDWSCATIKPTLVTLSGFRAYVEGGRVVVAWETVAELDTTGFYIERYSEETGKYVRLNKKLLPGLITSPAGGFYQLIDETAAPYGKHIYRLIEATSKGNLLIYGPFAIDLGDPGTSQIVKKFASDGTIEITIKGSVATTVRNASTASDSGFEQMTNTFSRKAREASPDTKARLAAARSEQEKTKLRKKDRKGSAIKVTVLENNVYYIDSSDIGTMLNMPSQSVQQIIRNGLLTLTTRDGQASYMPAKDNAGIFFYGTSVEGIYTNENIYWLKNDKGLLMGSVDGGKASLSGTAKDSFTETLHLEQELIPATAVTTDPNSDYWFWDYVIADFSPYDNRDFSFKANSVSTSANTAKIKLRMMSLTPERSHALISLNGTLVAEEIWNGIDPHTFTVNVDQRLFKEGDNTLSVKAALDADIYFSLLLIDSFDIEYARRFEAVNDLLSFKSEGSPSISVKGFSVPDITVFDISDTLKPKLVTSTSISGQAGNYSVKFYPAVNAVSYIAFASPSVKEADAFADLPSDLKRKDNAADYIVIAPEELKDGATLLADYRKSKGLTSKVVLLEDIMDEFNFGMYDPNAIRNFLQYAYNNWKKKSRYAVFVGSGTYDYKDAMGFGGNLMPPLMVGTMWGLAPSDSILGDFTGDNVPEIVIGRIPVLTPAELQTGLDKIKSFESNRVNGIMMLADSPDGGGDFAKDSDDIAQILTGYPVLKVYLSDHELDQARDLLFDGMNRGVAFVNYMGHAGIDQLSEGGLLTGYDAELLHNSRYPVLTALSCMAGHFAFPGYESLSELLLVKNGGGIVSAWAPSDFSYNADAKVLGEGFYQAVLQPEVLTIGEAVVRSMAAYRSKGRTSYELNIFNLLGDPALRIK